jgi:hypothetical protein
MPQRTALDSLQQRVDQIRATDLGIFMGAPLAGRLPPKPPLLLPAVQP